MSIRNDDITLAVPSGPSAPTSKFRRKAAGVCLVLAPIAFSAAELLAPEGGNDGPSTYAAWSAHRGTGLAGALVGLVATMLFLPAFFGLVAAIASRGRRVANIALGALVYGLVTAHAALVGVNLVFYAATSPTVDRAAAVHVIDALMHEVAVAAPLLLGHYVFTIGVLLLAVAAVRSARFPRWAGWAVIAGVLSDVVLGSLPLDGLVGDVVSEGLLIVGFGYIGLRLLSSRVAR
ncbi:DUF4386 family protein [Kribbella sp. GL6]|uniref:DUF4386 family protein n=1 Tax=Kribbella sp. GL6 TaxID=3419765 RepID=UPI003D007ED6